jgi:hypothetical protein
LANLAPFSLQATIRSVLILKEGGTMSLAGGAAGVFVMVEMLIFKELVKLIPKAVFSGILFKVGYEVFDFTPISLYLKKFIEAGLDKRRSVDALKRRHLKASSELAAYEKPPSELEENFDSESSLFIPTKSKQHAPGLGRSVQGGAPEPPWVSPHAPLQTLYRTVWLLPTAFH